MTQKTTFRFVASGVVLFFISNFLVISPLHSASSYTPPKQGGLPNEFNIVKKVANEHPDWLANMYDKYDNPNGTWQFLDEVVKQLRAKDPRWAYNGKRGNPKDPSMDVVAYYYGPGTAPTANTINMLEVYLVDVMTYGQPVHWSDITLYEATPCVYGSYLYPRNSPMAVPELPETPPSCDNPLPPIEPPPTGPVIPPIPGVSFEVEATPGWAGSLAFNSTNNTWLVVSSAKGDQGGTSKANYGRIMSNNMKPITPIFRIATSQFEPLAPRAVYSIELDKFLVVWVNATAYPGGEGILYGQFINPDGSFDGNIFEISKPNGAQFTTGATSLQYDSKNKKFVYVWENRTPGISAYLIKIDAEKRISPIIRVAANGKENRGASLAINETKNEYCVGYNITGDVSISTRGVAIAIRPVNAGNDSIGPQSVILGDAGLTGIVYNPQDEEYLITYTKENTGNTYGKFLKSCSKAGASSEMLLQENQVNSSLSYNPSSNTYAMIGQEGTNWTNKITIIDASGNHLFEASLFPNLPNGNFAPVVTANTINGTYGATSSKDYGTTNFASNLGAGEVSLITTTSGAFPSNAPLPVPSRGLPTDLGQIIGAIFVWSLSLIGLVLFVRFFYAGFLWFTAAGNASNVSQAKDIMWNAVYGTLILFSAWLILNTINPDLVGGTVNLPGLPATTEVAPQNPNP